MQEQLNETVEETDPHKTLPSGKKKPRPLGAVLLARGFIGQEDLVSLLDEQNRRYSLLEAFRKMQKVEYLFGQLLVKNNHCTQNQINKCLEKQQAAAEKGTQPVPRLGELLVEHGFVDRAVISDMLRLQNKDVLFCTGCGRQYNVVGLKGGMTYKCKSCGGLMMQKKLLESLKADETSFGFEFPSEER